MNYEIGHDTWTLVYDDNMPVTCPRCHRVRACGRCEDNCYMCQSCYHKVHGMGELPSDTMNL